MILITSIIVIKISTIQNLISPTRNFSTYVKSTDIRPTNVISTQRPTKELETQKITKKKKKKKKKKKRKKKKKKKKKTITKKKKAIIIDNFN